MLEVSVYRGCRIADLDTLKNAITTEWVKITKDVVTRSTDSFRKRLKRDVEVKGGHFENIFKHCDAHCDEHFYEHFMFIWFDKKTYKKSHMTSKC